jgi:hypothetical protein
LAQLVIETVQHPDQALQNLIRAARQLSQTLRDVVGAFQAAGDEFADEFVRTVRAIGENVRDMLVAVLEVAVGWLDTVVFQLMNLLNGFRSLTARELADAQLVFANTIDWDHVWIATDTPTNDIIFGIQDFFTGNPTSRAFVTGNLINFDADEGPVQRHTLIHELTHVWQNQNVGPVYMGHAIWEQIVQEDAYNYGYDKDDPNGARDVFIVLPNAIYGPGATFIDSDSVARGAHTGQRGTEVGNAVLEASNDFMDFNPEQQGQIMMHYFVRRVLQTPPAPELAPWQKFVDWVHTHPNPA